MQQSFDNQDPRRAVGKPEHAGSGRGAAASISGKPERSGDIPPPPASLGDPIAQLRRRLLRQASLAVGMLETAIEALWQSDKALIRSVLDRDDRIDLEEVLIEESCFELITLQGPFARDFREIAFVLKANQDIERVADHACSIAKIARAIGDDVPSAWPPALLDMAERVPTLCHRLLRAVIDEDIETARELVAGDKTIDRLDKRVFAESTELIERDPQMAATGIRVARVGRELERIGDLMVNIAEDIVYLATGTIIRHEGRTKQKPA